MRGSTSRRILTTLVGVLAVAIVAFLAVGLIVPDSWPGRLLRGTAIQTGGDQPTYGSATVDGAYASDWDLANDFFADMHRAGNPNKPIEAKLYLRYDCPSSTMYVLVLSAGSWPVETAGGTSESWIKINGSKANFTQFAWVDQGYDGNSGHAKGYEAAFTQQQGDYNIQAHVNVYDGGESQTADSTSVGISIICGHSTAVTISYFEAKWSGEGGATIGGKAETEGGAAETMQAVTLRWETASEIDNLGFNVYRGESPEGPWEMLNSQLIPSQVPPGSPVGATYEWLDKEIKAGGKYFYILEDVDVRGGTERHGPVQPQ